MEAIIIQISYKHFNEISRSKFYTDNDNELHIYKYVNNLNDTFDIFLEDYQKLLIKYRKYKDAKEYYKFRQSDPSFKEQKNKNAREYYKKNKDWINDKRREKYMNDKQQRMIDKYGAEFIAMMNIDIN